MAKVADLVKVILKRGKCPDRLQFGHAFRNSGWSTRCSFALADVH